MQTAAEGMWRRQRRKKKGPVVADRAFEVLGEDA
jgi:hypothetical protein